MSTLKSALIKDNHEFLLDTDTCFKKRNNNHNDDDNISWLITFADLMTILLVFSFFMLISNQQNNQNSGDIKKTADSFISLTPLAHANTAKNSTNLTLSLDIYDEKSPSDNFSDIERIIDKKLIYFASNKSQLRRGFMTDLNKLALISKKNPSSKIILTTYNNETSKLSVQRAITIVGFLVDECKIEKKKIFTQNLPLNISSSGLSFKNTPNDRLIEVKLIKDFWQF